MRQREEFRDHQEDGDIETAVPEDGGRGCGCRGGPGRPVGSRGRSRRRCPRSGDQAGARVEPSRSAPLPERTWPMTAANVFAECCQAEGLAAFIHCPGTMPSRTRSRRPASRRPTGGGTTDTWACLRRLLPRHRRDCGVQRAVGRLPRDGHGALHDRARRLFPHPDPERRRPGLRRGYGETEGDGGRHLARPEDDQRRDEVGQDHPDRRPRLGAHRRSVPADEDRHSPIDAPDLPQRRARR